MKDVSALNSRGNGYSVRLVLKFSPEMAGIEATIEILRALLEIIKINEKGIIQDIDPDFLHDFRVSVRKTRSALSQIKNVLPGKIVSVYKEKFAFLQASTNKMRDME